MQESVKDRLVAALMLVAFAAHLIPDDFLIASAELEAIDAIREFRMWTGPAYILVIAMAVGFFGTIVGGFARVFGWKHSRTVLVVAAVGSLVSFAGYETYASTNLFAAIETIWVFLMGWLIATPVPKVAPELRNQAAKYTYAASLAAFGALFITGWMLFASGEDIAYSADLSVEIESANRTDAAETETRLTVGKVSTIKLDRYIVDLLVTDSYEREIEMDIRIFENAGGERGVMLTPCIDVKVPISTAFGVGANCGELLFGLGGQIDKVE